MDIDAPNADVVPQQGISEEEAALYDRQIRLWGVEAQNRMRSASVLMINLRGIATETCKNIVLAGIGSLTVMDDQKLDHMDMATGFFYREEDVGKMRAEAARENIALLNPRVKIEAVTSKDRLFDTEYLKQFDVVCLTDSDPATITKLNELTRQLNIQFYTAGSIGMNGYIFADLLQHEFILEKVEAAKAGVEPQINVHHHSHAYVPFSQARAHVFGKLSEKKMRKLNPWLYIPLALWQYQEENDGNLPQSAEDAEKLKASAINALSPRSINANVLPNEFWSNLADSATAEFSPSCAIIGGILGQDMLSALTKKGTVIANLWVFDGTANKGEVQGLGMASKPEEIKKQ